MPIDFPPVTLTDADAESISFDEESVLKVVNCTKPLFMRDVTYKDVIYKWYLFLEPQEILFTEEGKPNGRISRPTENYLIESSYYEDMIS